MKSLAIRREPVNLQISPKPDAMGGGDGVVQPQRFARQNGSGFKNAFRPSGTLRLVFQTQPPPIGAKPIRAKSPSDHS